MSKRQPTNAEKRLWQESNKFTKKHKPDEALPEETEELLETVPEERLPPAAKAILKKNTPLPPLAPLPMREAKRYRATHPYIQATLDLHGLTRMEAYELVQQFVERNHRIGRRHVVIITGKGRTSEGVLRAELPHWLNDNPIRPMIASMFYASERDGGQGVMHMILKRFSQ